MKSALIAGSFIESNFVLLLDEIDPDRSIGQRTPDAKTTET